MSHRPASTRDTPQTMMNAIGVNTWVWASPLTDERLTELLPRIAGWGFDAVELPLENPGDWEPEGARERLGSLGLAPAAVIAAMAPGRELVLTDTATLEHTQAYLRATIDAAAAIGSPVVAGPLYASVGRAWRMSIEERRRAVTELRTTLRPLADYAAHRGVRLGVEPLNRYETSILNTVEQTLEALEGFPPEGCGIALDAYHMNIEERDPAAAVRTAGGAIAHVQVSANDRGAPGSGHIDWHPFLEALRDAGYDGPLCIESFTAENESIATAASVWRKLAPTQDHIAVDGLAFLRSALASRSTSP